jgi:hypothetical protein
MASFINASLDRAKQLEEKFRQSQLDCAKDAVRALCSLDIPGLTVESLSPEVLPVITEKGAPTNCPAITHTENRAVDDEVLKHRCVLATMDESDSSKARVTLFFKVEKDEDDFDGNSWRFSILAFKKDAYYSHHKRAKSENLLDYTGRILGTEFDRKDFQFYPARAR